MSSKPLHPHKGPFKEILAAVSGAVKPASTPPKSKVQLPKRKDHLEASTNHANSRADCVSVTAPPVEPLRTTEGAAAVASLTKEDKSQETGQFEKEPAVPKSPLGPDSRVQESTTFGTDLHLLASDFIFWTYSSMCPNRNVLTKQKRRWVEEVFLKDNKIDLLSENLGAIDGHTFIAARKYEFLQDQYLIGNIVGRTRRQDASYKQVFLGKDQNADGRTVKAWSSLILGAGCDGSLRVHRRSYGQSPAEEARVRVADCVTLPILVTCEVTSVSIDTLKTSGNELALLARTLRNIRVVKDSADIVRNGGEDATRMLSMATRSSTSLGRASAGSWLGVSPRGC
ncbi:MAG: hypothetical protein LQ347_001841 [Umbilicaria vellea]|nr:MAG: hypothetical protein LQ347_001841 [Umbilicaria vellea]